MTSNGGPVINFQLPFLWLIFQISKLNYGCTPPHISCSTVNYMEKSRLYHAFNRICLPFLACSSHDFFFFSVFICLYLASSAFIDGFVFSCRGNVENNSLYIKTLYTDLFIQIIFYRGSHHQYFTSNFSH